MRFNCSNLPKFLRAGVEMLEQHGFLKTSREGMVVTANSGDRIVIEKSDGRVHITYDTQPHFYMALARCMATEESVCVIEPKVKELGVMLDCSRNAVPRPELVKKLICLLSLAGYTYMELYTEDTYELPGEPYFGYKRGRYSASELKEMVAFADIFDFTLVPCIQALAHLQHLEQWKPYSEHMDTDGILLVGDERTYQLIRKGIRFFKEIFHTNRINIGTDEARRLGRGKYLDLYGHRTAQEIYLEHLQKVFEICKEEGVYPEFWADAFYLYGDQWDDEEVKKIFDGNQVPIMWEYISNDVACYKERFLKLKEYAGKVMYSGSFIKYYGYVPENTFAERATGFALQAVEECGVEDVLMTAWADNGSECSIFAVISSMWYTAEKLYPCKADLNAVVKELTGYTNDEWRGCERLNHMTPGEKKLCNAAKYILHNDFLIGLMDYHIPDDAGEIYAGLLPDFEALAERESSFSYVFQSYAALCKVLARKATYGKRLYRAYQNGDRRMLKELLVELKAIKKALEYFYQVFRMQWMKENKGFGFEVLDVRIGGLIARTDTVTVMVEDYLAGNVDVIYELEEERLKYDSGKLYMSDGKYALELTRWDISYTVNFI